MSKTIFPIIEVLNNKITSIDGDVSYFYRLLTPDLDHMDYIQKNNFYESIANGLNNIDTNSYFKFYRINNSSFVNTNSRNLPNFSEVTYKSQKNALNIFFQTNDIFSDVGIYDDYLSYNGQYLRIFSTSSFSDQIAHENLIPTDIDYVLTIKRNPKDKSVNKLEKIRSGHLSSFLKPKRDISSEGTYAQAEELMHDLIHGYESMFEMEFFFILKSSSLQSLNELSERLTSQMLINGVKVYSEGQSLRHLKSGLASIFNELIPGVKPNLKLREILNKTSHLKYLLPLKRSYLMDSGVKFHDPLDQEIFFNPFCENIKNRNMLVTGISGGGKSVFVNKLVHHLIQHHPTVILDKGGSFKKLTKYHDGQFLTEKFNPFEFKDPMYIREIILSVVDKNKFNKLERGRLLKEIKRHIPNSSCFLSLIENLKTSFIDIDLYFEDFKDYITDKETKRSNILYIDVENYPKSIIAPLVIYTLEYFKNISKQEKILVFDECWSFLKDHSLYIDECFRTFRKSGAFPIAISQSLNDFSSLSYELANSITNNCYFKVFFPQEINEAIDITDFDITNIKSLEFEKNVFSECYLKSTDNKYRKILKNYLSPLELELFHTEAGKDKKLNSFLNKFSEFFDSNQTAINSFVRLKHEDHSNDFYINYER